MPRTVDIHDFTELPHARSNPSKFRLPDKKKAQIIRIAPGVKKDQLQIVELQGTDKKDIIIEPLHPGWINADQRPDPRARRG